MFHKSKHPIEPVSAYVYGSDYPPLQKEAETKEAVLSNSSLVQFFSKILPILLICLLTFCLLFVRFVIDESTLSIGLSAHLCPVEEGDSIICTISEEPYLTTVSTYNKSKFWVPVESYQSSWLQIEQSVEKSAVFKVLWTFDLQDFTCYFMEK